MAMAMTQPPGQHLSEVFGVLLGPLAPISSRTSVSRRRPNKNVREVFGLSNWPCQRNPSTSIRSELNRAVANRMNAPSGETPMLLPKSLSTVSTFPVDNESR